MNKHTTKTNLSLAVVCLATILVTVHVQAQDVAASGGDKKAVLDTIAQINHINWVVNVIKTYNNALVLEEEYEKISYGNLNLNRIPDEETRNRITNMLDVLYSLRKDEREMKHWRDKFLDDRMRKMREYDLGTAKRVWGLFREGIFGFMTYDIGTVLQTAFDVGHGCLSLQYDYDNFVHSFDQEMQDRVFAFDSQKMALLHKLNKEMLDDQWRLVRKHHLDDKATRVTDTDIKALLSVLKDGNASRIYTRLVSMKSRYRLFPEYWYYLSCAAMETGHCKEGRDACDTFFKVNRGIFRDDPMAGTVALNKAMMLDKDKANLPELKRCLEIIWEANQNRSNWEQDFVVASLYDGILHDNIKAVEILEHAIAALESEMSERKRMGKDIIALWKTLDKYHAYLFRLLPNEAMPNVIRTSEFVSFVDRLRYLKRDKNANVWETIKDDILGANVEDWRRNSWDGEWDHYIRMSIPLSWTFLDYPSWGCQLIESSRGESDIHYGSIPEVTNLNKTVTYKFLSKYWKSDFGKTFFRLQDQDIDSLISYQLKLESSSFPVALTFAYKGMNCSSDPYKIDNIFLFEFSILGKRYFWDPSSSLDAPSYSSSVKPQQRRDAFDSRYGFISLDQDGTGIHCPAVSGIKLMNLKSGKNVSIEYRNVTDKNFRPLVTLLFMNELGMVVGCKKDVYCNKFTKTHRTVPGFFFDDHYTDYSYQYLAPDETRTFTTPKPADAKYLMMIVEPRYNLSETKEGTL